jgi:coatomer subunit beta
MEFISEFSSTSAVDVINFIKEVVEKFPDLRPGIIEKLLATLSDIKAKKVFRGALWILGEYCIEETDIKDALRGIRNSVGELPILDTEKRLLEKQKDEEEATNETEVHAPSASRRVLADGTYATESALTESKVAAKLEAIKEASKPPLRCTLPTLSTNSSHDFGRRLLSCDDFVIDIGEIGNEILRNSWNQ